MYPHKTPFISAHLLLSEAVANGNRLTENMICYVSYREADGTTWYRRGELLTWQRQYASVAIAGKIHSSVKNSTVHLPLECWPTWPQGTTKESARLTMEGKA